MQNLRDQLLQKGLISKGQKQQVEQDKRRERKQLKKGQADAMAQEQQRQAYEARLEAQRAADRERAAAQRAQFEAREKFLQDTADHGLLAARRAYGDTPVVF